MDHLKESEKYFNQDILQKKLKQHLKEAGLSECDEPSKDYILHGLYIHLANLTENLILISRQRQFCRNLPSVPPPQKVLFYETRLGETKNYHQVARVVPVVIHEEGEEETVVEKDPIDMILATNPKERVEKIEAWNKHVEASRRKAVLEKMKQEETRGKPKKGKEKSQRYEALKEKAEKEQEETKAKQQLAKTEDTIQRFLTPGPVKRHRPRPTDAEMYNDF